MTTIDSRVMEERGDDELTLPAEQHEDDGLDLVILHEALEQEAFEVAMLIKAYSRAFVKSDPSMIRKWVIDEMLRELTRCADELVGIFEDIDRAHATGRCANCTS